MNEPLQASNRPTTMTPDNDQTLSEQSSKPDQRPLLETERLWLRPFERSDQQDVHRICSLKEVAANTRTIPHPYPEGMALEWIEKQPVQWSQGKAAVFAVCLKDESGDRSKAKLIGAVGMMISEEDQNAEIGYWMDQPFWGQGLCTEAVKTVLRFGLEDLGLHRIHAHYMTRNPASGRVMEKAGMKREGLLRGHVRKWGVFEDVVFYGILNSDLDAKD